MIRGAIVVAVLVAVFIGLARAGAVHGEMCLSQVGCVRAAKDKAAFERGPAPIVKQLSTSELVQPPG